MMNHLKLSSTALLAMVVIYLSACTAETSLLPSTPTMSQENPTQVTLACQPTTADAEGPFYEPNAPRREKVGEGYVLEGIVRATADCAPIPGAQLEFWLAGPDGEYADDFRATLAANEDGTYRFESHFPPPYSGRPPHIHIRISVEGYQTLVTQHYPKEGEKGASFDIVLVPQP